LVAKFSSSFRALVARAVERGELPEGTDIELVADIAPALVRYRRQTTGRHLDEAFINRVADQFFTPVKAAPTKQPGAVALTAPVHA
jgi:hypothetical protein